MASTSLQTQVIDYAFIRNLKSTNATLAALKNTIKQIWILKMQLRKLSSLERKADTRSKIMMGGLIKKAGLDALHESNPNALYGMLLDAKNTLSKEPQVLDKWAKLGQFLYLTKN